MTLLKLVVKWGRIRVHSETAAVFNCKTTADQLIRRTRALSVYVMMLVVHKEKRNEGTRRFRVTGLEGQMAAALCHGDCFRVTQTRFSKPLSHSLSPSLSLSLLPPRVASFLWFPRSIR